MRLIVISGPIAAGKSTVAAHVRRRLRERLEQVAVIDLDLIYKMLDDVRPMANVTTWRHARAAAVALANHLFVIGFRTVILEGDFWFGAERDAWRAEVQTGVVLTTVLLRVSLETARQRVQADEQRADSHNPVLLAQSRADFQNALSHLTPPDLDITTDALDIEAVARTIVDAVDR